MDLDYIKFIKFLKKCASPDEHNYTWIPNMNEMSRFSGKFNVTDDARFYKYYERILWNENLHLVQKQKPVGPMIFDLDFHQKEEHRLFNEKLIIKIITKIFNILYQLFDDNYVDIQKIYVLMKDKPVFDEKKEIYKDGLHIIIPELPIYDDIRYYIADKLQEKLIESQTLEQIKFINKKEVVDRNVSKSTNWMMYGSRKPGSLPYKLTYIFNAEMELIENNYDDISLVKLFCIRQYEKGDAIQPKLEMFKKKDKEKSKSKENTNTADDTDVTQVNVNVNVTSDRISEELREQLKQKKTVSRYNNPKQIEFAKNLINILKKKRADDYNDWIKIGWALFQVGGIDLLDIFKNFSKKSSKYKEGDCEKIFTHSKECEGFTIATLVWMAQQDNFEEYKKLRATCAKKHTDGLSEINHSDVAMILADMYGDVIKKSVDNIWYIFEGGRWKEDKTGHKISLFITDDFCLELLKIQNMYNLEAQNEKGLMRELLMKKNSLITDLYKKLRDYNFKEKIMKEFGYRVTDENFMERLDSKLNLFGFNNGVYDLDLDKFRQSTPDDYLTKTTGYDYVEVDKNCKEYKEIHKFFDDIFPDKSLRKYALQYLASCLSGSCRENCFAIWTGSGANGKSMLTILIRHTFGSYFIVAPSTILTRKQGCASNATPEIITLKGTRFCMFQEVEKNETINVGKLKEITSGDLQTGRQLFKTMETFLLQCKLCMTCNNLPDVNSVDGGTWRRFKVLPFEMEFVLGKPKNDFQRERNMNLEKELPLLKFAFINLLLDEFKEYKRAGRLNEPEKVIKHTMLYKQNNDIMFEFIDTNYVEEENPDGITLDDMYEFYKIWYTRCHSNNKAEAKKVLRDYLVKHYNERIKSNVIYCLVEKTKK